MKTCTKCKIDKELVNFSSRGNGRINSWCKVCHSNHTSNYKKNNKVYNERKKKLKKIRVTEIRQKIWDFLTEHSCIDCGEKDPVVLDFDHIKDKEFNISEASKHGYAWKTIEKEMNKCVIRCANCHRRKTAKERGFYKDLKQ